MDRQSFASDGAAEVIRVLEKIMRHKIYVLSHGREWKVKCEHCREQIFATQGEAIRTAKQHVAGFAPGTLSQILVQRDEGGWREEWTYGSDPFPPRG